MTFHYFDASAWVKRYYQERGSEKVHELIAGAQVRVCSVLGVVEVVAAMARKCKAQEISSADFEAKLAEIERDWRSFVKIELTLATVDLARDAAVESLERRLVQTGHTVVLVASDRELKEAAHSRGITVVDPDIKDAD